ncbi:MAG: hypothetical protein ACXWNR_06120 [Candidatus Limnocylindrales bacterium]
MPDDRRVLEGIDRMVVDGTNVLYAIRRSRTPAPAAALIGRMRALVPPAVAITVVLDGSPEHGLVARHIASGVEVRYAGRGSADDFITGLLDDRSRHDASGTLVITDDIELSNAARRLGARTVRTGWLIDRLDRQRLSAPAPGRPGLVPPAGPSVGQGSGDEEEAPRWSPGRGATRKRGNARRRPAGER